MDKKKVKRKLLALSAALAIATTYYSIDHVYHPQYEICADGTKAFATYSKGKIYIGSDYFLSSLKDVNEDDILVCDERFSKNNPNMQIYSSYRIDDKEIRNEILEVLCRYEECYPSPWDRTIESMRVEWAMHNLSYIFDHRRDHTTDVDLDNNDQEQYDNEILRKILKL